MQWCHRRFARREHLHRHERTHTKEKPHACKCGRTFSRRDLLARHLKLSDSTEEHAEVYTGQRTLFPEIPRLDGAAAWVAPGSSHLADDGAAMPSAMTASTSGQRDLSVVTDPNLIDFDINAPTELDLLWDDLEFPEPMEYATSSPGFPFNPAALGHYGISDQPARTSAGRAVLEAVEASPGNLSSQDTLSSYESRLPSLQPQQDEHLSAKQTPHTSPDAQNDEETHAARQPLYVSRESYNHIQALVDSQKHCLPPGFRLPSRHAFNRYVEGFSSFLAHVPFIHLPTINFMQMPLELALAIFAVGAQFRLERNEAYALIQASKCMINLPLGLGDTALNASMPQPMQSSSPSNSSASGALAGSDHSRYRTTTSSSSVQQPLDIQTLQAMIIITSVCTYNHRDLLPQAFVLADQMAQNLRYGDYLNMDANLTTNDWSEWVQIEERRRTVLAAFLFLNIHTIIYKIPPRLMKSEISSVRIPQPETHWQASTPRQWLDARRKDAPISATFGESYSELFAPELPQRRGHESSAFGNLLIMHGIIQQIHLAREALMGLEFNFSGNQSFQLPDDIARKFKSALQRWQRKWTMNKDSSTRPNSPTGPLGFNATALFRVACLRVDFDIGTHRKLETRDSALIADTFRQAPRPPRSPRLYAALRQSAHALSIPVRLGVQYVAKTQTLTWSIIHSLCNLECALFLSKWLEELSLGDQPLLKDEEGLLCVIADMLEETPFLELDSPRSFSGAVLRRMSAAVVRLVAELFVGVHVSEFMDSFEEAIKQYASYLEKKVELEEEQT